MQEGDVLVTDMTDPNWGAGDEGAPAIVTNRGGCTCHAAIIARELGIPAIVGCGNATGAGREGGRHRSCAEGDTGHVYRGKLDSRSSPPTSAPAAIPAQDHDERRQPGLAFEFAQIPNGGVGLARLEFVINNMIGIHPGPSPTSVPAGQPARRDHPLAAATRRPGSSSSRSWSRASPPSPRPSIRKPVIVRLSDFKSNEYRKLLGGEIYEPGEENPMLGFRGASRYIAHSFRDCFEMKSPR